MNDKLNNAMNHISDQHLSEAESFKRPSRRPYWIVAAAAVLGLVIGLSAADVLRSPADPTRPIMLDSRPDYSFTVPSHQSTYPTAPEPGSIQSPDTWQLANLVAAPEYPEMMQRPDSNGMAYSEYAALLDAWKQDQAAQYDQPQGYADSLTDFFRQSIPKFLDAEKNSTYSPANVYMALALLAETTDGNSRQQILDLLGLESIDQLREQVSHVWNAHYSDDGATTLLLGNSLWLSDNYSFKQACLDTLAETYYASSFYGPMGSEEFNEQLRQWINANTGNLLTEQAQALEMSPDTLFALASTVYFSANWENGFMDKLTEDKTFHSYGCDTVAAFMKDSFYGTYYQGTNFGAVALELSGENCMWLILPDEGYTVADILKSDEYLRLTTDPAGWSSQHGNIYIHLQVPKFDVSSDMDLVAGLKEMGITDVFDYKTSDFSTITDVPDLFVNKVSHAARVAIDEDGCVAAAFTVTLVYAGSSFTPPVNEMDFVLDRPFLFVISSRDNLPLFAGTVVQP